MDEFPRPPPFAKVAVEGQTHPASEEDGLKERRRIWLRLLGKRMRCQDQQNGFKSNKYSMVDKAASSWLDLAGKASAESSLANFLLCY